MQMRPAQQFEPPPYATLCHANESNGRHRGAGISLHARSQRAVSDDMDDNGTVGIDKLQGIEQNNKSLVVINSSDPNKMQCVCRKFIGIGRYNSACNAVLRQPDTVYTMDTPDIVAIFGSSGQQYIRNAAKRDVSDVQSATATRWRQCEIIVYKDPETSRLPLTAETTDYEYLR